jgi:hypothetical protein
VTSKFQPNSLTKEVCHANDSIASGSLPEQLFKRSFFSRWVYIWLLDSHADSWAFFHLEHFKERSGDHQRLNSADYYTFCNLATSIDVLDITNLSYQS